MSKLKVGDIILLKPRKGDVVGEMIVDVTKSEFSHAAMVYSVKKDDIRIVELVKGGVKINKIRARKAEKDNYNGYVMRLRTEYDPDILKNTADHMMKRKIRFDYKSLFILKEFVDIHKHIYFDQESSHGAEYFLLAAAEFINLAAKTGLSRKGSEKDEERMHCVQFIYNLFHESGDAYRLGMNGGIFLSDFNINDANKAKYKINPNEIYDKVDYLSELLHDKLAVEAGSHAESMSRWGSVLSPIINKKKYRMELQSYDELMESRIPIASSLVTAGDFIENAVNLEGMGYYEISAKRKKAHGRKDDF